MESLPKVLLLGDSIRGSYQAQVAELLKGKANVVWPNVNCQFTLFTLASLSIWIGELGEPQIVHWNNGLHDAGHNPNRAPVQIPLNDYQSNLRFILRQLQAMSAKVIWATTTPVHPTRPFRTDEWSWRNEEIDEYNRVARELMESNNIPINDLHKVVWNGVDEYLVEDMLHLNEAGKTACAKAVAEAISVHL